MWGAPSTTKVLWATSTKAQLSLRYKPCSQMGSHTQAKIRPSDEHVGEPQRPQCCYVSMALNTQIKLLFCSTKTILSPENSKSKTLRSRWVLSGSRSGAPQGPGTRFHRTGTGTDLESVTEVAELKTFILFKRKLEPDSLKGLPKAVNTMCGPPEATAQYAISLVTPTIINRHHAF